MFGKTIPVVNLFGFEVKIDASWLILAALISWSLAAGYFPVKYGGLAPAVYWVMGVAGALGLFASIIFHELSHSLVARRYGLPIKGITLFIFGGVAEMNDEPSSARAEFYMAVVGPLSSIALGFLFYILAGWGWPRPVAGVLNYLHWINWVLAGFNLVPAFPLDGGRMLRSVLWNWKNDLMWATRVAAGIGSGFGLFLVVFGILRFFTGNFIGGVWSFLIGLFLQSASSMSYQAVLVRSALEGDPVRRFVNDQPVTVSPQVPVGELVENYVYRYHHKMFPVVEAGSLKGCVTTRDIHALPRPEWDRRRVADIMAAPTDRNTVSADTDAAEVLSLMHRNGTSRVMVVEGERLLGIVTLKDLMKFISTKLDFEGDGPGNARK